MRNRKSISIILVMAFFLVGCAALVPGSKNFGNMTPKEKSTFFMSTYNTQFNDTMYMAQQTNLTDKQKKVVNAKRSILIQAWPLIKTYDAVVAGGGVPTAESEQEIYNLINQLISVGG